MMVSIVSPTRATAFLETRGASANTSSMLTGQRSSAHWSRSSTTLESISRSTVSTMNAAVRRGVPYPQVMVTDGALTKSFTPSSPTCRTPSPVARLAFMPRRESLISSSIPLATTRGEIVCLTGSTRRLSKTQICRSSVSNISWRIWARRSGRSGLNRPMKGG